VQFHNWFREGGREVGRGGERGRRAREEGGRSVWEKTVLKTKVLKTKGTVFSHTDRLSPVNNMFNFFSCSKLASQITNGFVYAALVIQWACAPSIPTICKKSSKRTSNSDSRQKKDVLKNIRFSNYFMLPVFISLIKFSKIVLVE